MAITNKDDIKTVIVPILEGHKAIRAGLFGSMAKGNARQDSDLDILVDFGNNRLSLLDFVGIKLELEDVTGRKVDLVEYSMIKPLLRDKILKEEVPIIWPEK